MTWFIVLFVHCAASATCPSPTMVTIAMPSEEVCKQVRDLNADLALKCWAQPAK